MRGGPLSAWELLPVPAFQTKWLSQAYRTATPYQPCGPRCTIPTNLSGTQQPMRIRRSNLTQTLVNSQAYAQAYINRSTQPLSTTLGPHPSKRAAWIQGLPLLLSYQDFRSEQLRFPDKDRDHLPPSATPTTSWRLHRRRSLPARASSPSSSRFAAHAWGSHRPLTHP